MDKILIICGPTATGKTRIALKIAKKFGGEIISADSRQVFEGKNIVYGKDLPKNIEPQVSNIKWRDRYLKYYVIDGIRVWLYDVVAPHEPFNIAFWKECADLVIQDIISRNKLPIVVGGTGLYIKSLTQSLSQISIAPNLVLRNKLANKSVKYLFSYLNRVDSSKAASLNTSDRRNPRRLIRALEIALSQPDTKTQVPHFQFLQLGLTAPRTLLYQLVDQRVTDRIASGAASEDPQLAGQPDHWASLEHAIVRHQLTWFKKQSPITWFDVTVPNWQPQALKTVSNWYNKGYAAQN